MGCSNTKSEDAKKSTESTRQRQGTHSVNQSVPSTPVGIGIEDKNKNVSAGKLATSFHDQREGETEYFKKIIDNTISDFIDISTVVTTLDDKNAEERVKEYRIQMQDSLRLKPQEVANLLVFSLPSVSQSNNQTSAVNLLSVNRVTDTDIEFTDKWIDMITPLVHNGLPIKDCGKLVVSFD